METRDFKLEIKALAAETGTFEGLLSVYDVIDEQQDVVTPGAFSKTLQESSGVVPLLWQHDPHEMLGTLELTDGPRALKAQGKLVLEVAKARELYALLKSGALKGLSIGYRTIKSDVQNGVRYLREIRLFEGSLVAYPANPAAVVTAVKGTAETDEDIAAFRNAARDIKGFYTSLL